MTATNQDVIDEVNSLKGFVETTLTDTSLAKDAALQAANAANAANPTVTQAKVIYLSTQSGSDANDGLSPTTPVLTLSKAFFSAVPGVRLVIRTIEDCYFNQSVTLNSPPPHITLEGWSTESNSIVQRAFTRGQSARFLSYGVVNLDLTNLDIDVGGADQESRVLFPASAYRLNLKTLNCEFLKTGFGTFYHNYGQNFGSHIAANTVIDPSARGSIYGGVAANADPNSVLFKTNNPAG